MARITTWMLAACTAALLAAPAASAQQPITPLGVQLQLTTHGAGATTDAVSPAAAWNSQRNEYMLAYIVQTVGGVADSEVFVRRLGANGTPLSPPTRVSGLLADGSPDGTPGFDAAEVAIAYDVERDRYAVGFTRAQTVVGNLEMFVQLVSAEGGPIKFNGDAGPDPKVISSVGGVNADTPASDPALIYSPDADGNDSPGDRYVGVYVADNDLDAVFNELNVIAGSVSASGTTTLLNRNVSAMGGTGDAFAPSIVRIPGGADYAVAWEGFTATASDREIWVNLVPENLPNSSATQRQATATAPGPAASFAPSLAADTDANQLLVAYSTRTSDAEGQEIYQQRLSPGMADIGAEARVSAAGPPDSPTHFVEAAAAAYNPRLKRYLVTWRGNDDDRPGLSTDEFERAGAVLAPDGAKLSEFTISRMGIDNDEDFGPTGTGAVVPNATSGRWLALWAGDEAVDNAFDVFGREVGENFDEDGDGVRVDAGDCNDKDASVHPGATEVFDNGIDEDCSGADAENPDRDGDGSNRPADCNDGNPFVKPGATDVPGNGVDEDCAGGDATLPASPPPPPAPPQLTRASLDFSFATFPGRFTQVKRFRVLNAKAGMTIRISCKGASCPRKTLRKPRTIRVRKAGRHNLLSLFKGARLRSGVKLEVRIIEPGAIGKVNSFTFRKNAGPRRSTRCIAVGKTSPGPCPNT